MEINEQLVNKLIEKNYKISFAESCTGGMAASYLVDVANASWVLDLSLVTYANEAKIKYLGVRPETIEKYNVVSEEVAREMALGVCEAAGSNIGVGITGAAGPTSDGIIPVGRVCIGFKINEKSYEKTLNLGPIGRNNVRKRVVEFVYMELLRELNNEE